MVYDLYDDLDSIYVLRFWSKSYDEMVLVSSQIEIGWFEGATLFVRDSKQSLSYMSFDLSKMKVSWMYSEGRVYCVEFDCDTVFVYAGPGCGKSTSIQMFKRIGMRCCDTDDGLSDESRLFCCSGYFCFTNIPEILKFASPYVLCVAHVPDEWFWSCCCASKVALGENWYSSMCDQVCSPLVTQMRVSTYLIAPLFIYMCRVFGLLGSYNDLMLSGKFDSYYLYPYTKLSPLLKIHYFLQSFGWLICGDFMTIWSKDDTLSSEMRVNITAGSFNRVGTVESRYALYSCIFQVSDPLKVAVDGRFALHSCSVGRKALYSWRKPP